MNRTDSSSPELSSSPTTNGSAPPSATLAKSDNEHSLQPTSSSTAMPDPAGDALAGHSALPSENSPSLSPPPQDAADGIRPPSRASHRHSALHARSLDSAAEQTPPSQTLAQPPTRRATADTDRSRRRRSAMDFRGGARISDLFTNFLSRRQEPEQSPTVAEDAPRPPSPAPHPPPMLPVVNEPKPDPPPPCLPPPTLSELGLSMSVLTGNLNPAHFSNPPTSGTLLLPHYLLLCHSQGLDVLPLVTPPAPEPYALIRRISFKSVVVMEERGVLIAIAGRRDGVRVYALDELRRVIQWRLDIETRKEKEKSRKEESKKLSGNVDHVFGMKVISSGERFGSKHLSQLTNGSHHHQPRPPVVTRNLHAATNIPRDPPPAYSASTHSQSTGSMRRPTPPQPPPRTVSVLPVPETRGRSGSVSAVLTAGPSQRPRIEATEADDDDANDQKGDWAEAEHSSDDEALSLAAAGASGSAALDERTSAMSSGGGSSGVPGHSPRPANLRDIRSSSVAVLSPRTESGVGLGLEFRENQPEPTGEIEDEGLGEEDEEVRGRAGDISLAQALLESRIPELPPPGTRLQQQPILLTSTSSIQVSNSTIIREPEPPVSTGRAGRRRWSILGPSSSAPSRPQNGQPVLLHPSRADSMTNLSRTSLRRSSSILSTENRSETTRQSSQISRTSQPEPTGPRSAPARPSTSHSSTPPVSSHRFFPRIFSLGSRRKSEEDMRKAGANVDKDPKHPANVVSAPPPPQPKLDYVKLPGTKGSVLIKAVETQRKSFLAILCGENGEKVELFAGTYRTALSLSRTFILPDSPRSIELQVQGDDLVEIYLVFAQNVFGLEPATVRVREVRIGRAERRAARRRAREGRSNGGEETPALQDEEHVPPVERPPENITLGMEDRGGEGGDEQEPEEGQSNLPTTTSVDTGELMALVAAQSAPYTTFQQLSFAPPFPLATLGDEVTIPPSYPDFLRHKDLHEDPSADSQINPAPQSSFTPPGLPPPRLLLQCKWYYRDPKGVVQGPWNTALMQSWYKDGLLPLDLPVRRDMDPEFTSLKELRSQAVDPEQPFKQLAPVSSAEPPPPPPAVMEPKPLLPPVSILEQPRHYGPPALFFSSRGGHSTTIVDAKGRPVLKGRFVWSVEDDEAEQNPLHGKLGDIRRVEAFEVFNRTVIVALRQCGLEATDVGDALFKPADESRAYIPHYQAPPAGFSRRGCYMWKIGGPLAVPQDASPVASRLTAGAHGKKASTGILRSSIRPDTGSSTEDAEFTGREEVIFLGRREDDVYLCERNGVSFRILRLSSMERSTIVS